MVNEKSSNKVPLLETAKPKSTWTEVANYLDSDLPHVTLTLEQINEAIANGYVERGLRGIGRTGSA